MELMSVHGLNVGKLPGRYLPDQCFYQSTHDCLPPSTCRLPDTKTILGSTAAFVEQTLVRTQHYFERNVVLCLDFEQWNLSSIAVAMPMGTNIFSCSCRSFSTISTHLPRPQFQFESGP